MNDQPASWIKSSLSAANGNCVEVASLPGGQVAVRHSKNPDGPSLRFTAAEWAAFVAGVHNGEFGESGPTGRRASETISKSR